MLNYEEWKTQRFNGIGGTDMAAILGKSPWKTKMELFNEKISKIDTQKENRAMRRGRFLESLVADEYKHITGIKLTTKCKEFTTNILLKHNKYPWMFANVDRFVPEHKAIAEIKTVTLNKYIDIKINGLPDHWIIQIQHYLNITGLSKAVLIIFCHDRWEFIEEKKNGIWIDRDPDMIKTMESEAINFWENNIQKCVPPTTDDFDTCPVLDIKKNGFMPKSTTLASEEWKDLSFNLKETKGSLIKAKKDYDKKELAIKDYMIRNNIKIASGGYIRKISYTDISPRTTWDSKGMYNELMARGVKNLEERFKKTGNKSKRFFVAFF